MSARPLHFVWFRNDLRLHDHEPLNRACQAASRDGGTVAMVYVVDPFFFGKTRFGFPRIGPFRQHFLFTALRDLKANLGQRGTQLILLRGPTSEVLTHCLQTTSAEGLYFYRDVAPEEQAIEAEVIQAARTLGVQCRSSSPCMLLDFDHLPFDLCEVPEVFTKFRHRVESDFYVPPASSKPVDFFPTPIDRLVSVNDLQLSQIESLIVESRSDTDRAALHFRGGETAALERLDQYLWQRDRLREYKKTRNGMLGPDYSSKLSPWLALGCVSARQIYFEIRRYEQERVENDSTYWLIFELLWRDYFKLLLAKHQGSVFQQQGLRQRSVPWSRDRTIFDRWKDSQTGYPLIDANLRELAETGFMSNRGRQNVASFLTKNLGIDWRMGAEWFESMLIDYDPASNYGNWNYVAGVGSDARKFRWFNTIKQSQEYDPDGDYIRFWLPELRYLPSDLIHTPWQMSADQQNRFQCLIGQDYPSPIVDLHQSAERRRAQYS